MDEEEEGGAAPEGAGKLGESPDWCSLSMLKRDLFMFDREVDEEEEEGAAPWKEQENWESHQIASASLRTGAKDIKSKQKAYDYVFEDSIAFVKDQMLAGVFGDDSSVTHLSRMTHL